MKCEIAKWLVSSARNRGRNLPGPVSRHLGRCASCRDFARFTLALSETARRDGRDYLEKIPSPETDGLLDKSPAGAKPSLSPRPPARRLWIPASVAAAGLVLTALLIFLPTAPSRKTTLWEEIAELKKLPVSGEAIRSLAAGAESPLAQEYDSLVKSAASAARAIQASLDLIIGFETQPGRAGRRPA